MIDSTPLVNASVRATLSEDADDLATALARENEPNLRFEDVLRKLNRHHPAPTKRRAK